MIPGLMENNGKQDLEPTRNIWQIWIMNTEQMNIGTFEMKKSHWAPREDLEMEKVHGLCMKMVIGEKLKPRGLSWFSLFK